MKYKKRVERIELSSLAWKAKVLPLNYTRLLYNKIINVIPSVCIDYIVFLSPKLLLLLSFAPCLGGFYNDPEIQQN